MLDHCVHCAVITNIYETYIAAVDRVKSNNALFNSSTKATLVDAAGPSCLLFDCSRPRPRDAVPTNPLSRGYFGIARNSIKEHCLSTDMFNAQGALLINLIDTIFPRCTPEHLHDRPAGCRTLR